MQAMTGLTQVLSASKRDIASHPSLPLSMQMMPVLLPRYMTNGYGVVWHIVSLVWAGIVLVVVASEVSIQLLQHWLCIHLGSQAAPCIDVMAPLIYQAFMQLSTT